MATASSPVLAPPSKEPFSLQAWLYANSEAIVPRIALASMAAAAAVWYGWVLFRLPIYGDAANHARIARDFLDKGFFETVSPYPPLYHILGAIGLSFAGEDGFIAITLLAVVGLGIATYLLATEVTGSPQVGLVAAAIAYMTPKTSFYAGRLYMEVFLVVLFLLALWALHRYFVSRRTKDLVLCAVFCALAAVTKQQGLLLLALPVGLFLGLLALRNARSGFQSLLFRPVGIYVAIVGLLVVPALAWQARGTGQVLPESDYTAWVNDAVQVLTGEPKPEWQVKWDDELDRQFEGGGYLARGSEAHESRHIWPLQALTTPDGFFGVHAPYWLNGVGSGSFPLPETILLSFLFATGLGAWLASRTNRTFLAFLAFFLALNYLAFLRNNDQLRYHLFIPYILAFAIPYGVWYASRTLWPVFAHVALLCLAVFLLAYGIRYLPDRSAIADVAWGLQAYAPSVGGVQSIVDTSKFIDASLDPDETFYAVPSTEYGYYSEREAVFDYRIYFLPEGQLRQVLDDMGVSMLVLANSAILPDAGWNHLFKVPQSFADRVAALYPLVYTSPKGDISVYRVRP